MSLSNRFSRHWTRPTASCLAVAGLGLAGLAGCALKMSPGERLASVAHEDTEVKPPIATSALSRILERKSATAKSEESATAEQDATAQKSSSSTSRGRLFSAIVDRFPSRNDDVRDPFLDAESAPAFAKANTAAREAPNAARPQANAEPAVAEAATRQRTDEELWKLFDSEAVGVVRTGDDDPTLAARAPAETPKHADVPEDSLPVWARPKPGRTAARSTTPKTRAASTSVNAPPVRPLKSAELPTVAPHSAADATVATAARRELHDLVTQAREHEQRGALQQARQSAADAVAIADRERFEFAPGEERPADVFRRLDERLSASTRDPFGDAPQESAAAAALQGTSPFASGTTLTDSLPWKTRIQPQPDTAPPAPAPERKPSAPATNFPAAPEWRGVRANSPVSLAVVEQPEFSASPSESPSVRHADVEDVGAALRTPGRLLPRTLPAAVAPAATDDRSLALSAPPIAEGPLLAPPLDVTPLAAAPAPPILADGSAASLTLPATADEELQRSSGKAGWIIGGVLLAAGLWLFGFRGGRATRRNSSASGR